LARKAGKVDVKQATVTSSWFISTLSTTDSSHTKCAQKSNITEILHLWLLNWQPQLEEHLAEFILLTSAMQHLHTTFEIPCQVLAFEYLKESPVCRNQDLESSSDNPQRVNHVHVPSVLW